jgi:hypothetical protein
VNSTIRQTLIVIQSKFCEFKVTKFEITVGRTK